MSDELNFGKPLDDDYIGVEKRRADVSVTDDDDDKISRRPSDANQSPDRHLDLSHVLDDGNGAGASSQIDDIIDDGAVIENDGRSKTRTFYYADEAPSDKQHQFARMLRWQDGEGDSDRAVRNRAADRRRTVDTFCAHVGMGTEQRERVQYVTDGLNMSHMGPYSSDDVILAIITLIANERGRFIRDETVFRGLLEDVGLDLNDIKNVRGLIREKSARL